MSDKGSRDELKGRASGAESTTPVARLCYVDDSRTSAYVVRRLLQPYGYQIDYFQSAEPAFVALIQEDYDLLLTDLKVSSKGMDGDDLIRTLRQSGHPKLSSLPVIVITGASDARVLVDVYDAGANQVMSKPVDAEELDGHIRRLLPESKPELRVVEQQHDRDNVVPLSAAQRPVQVQPQSTANNAGSSLSSSPADSSIKTDTTSSHETKNPEADVPVLDAASPIQTNVSQEIDDVKQDDNLNISKPESAIDPVNIDTVQTNVSQEIDDVKQGDNLNTSKTESAIDPANIDTVQTNVSQEIDDVKQGDNLNTSKTESAIDPANIDTANNEKESLLERAVSRQEELKEEQNKVENEKRDPETGKLETGKEDNKAWEIVDDVVSPYDDQNIKDEVIIEPSESINNQADTTRIPVENENILHEMDKHALIVRDRTSLFSDSSILGAFTSLVELVGVGNLVKRIILAGIGIFVVLMAWNIFYDQGQPVDTALVETGEIFQSITVPGRVLSKQRVNISSAHTGRTVKILVKEGDKVKAGQVLVKMDARELVSRHNRAKANLADAREGVVLARRTLNRLRKAYKKGAVARRFVEDAEVDLSSARSQAGIAVEEAHSANLELSKQEVTAPFSGTITARFAEVGQWVGPSEALFTLVDESQRAIEVRVDAADSVAIDVGQVVAVSSDAFPGLEWHESVTRLGTAANNDRNSNSVKVYISLGNDAPSLRFGQQVDADIRTAWNPNTLKVPFETLINRDGQTFVAVLIGGQVKLKPVETGIEDFSMVEIKQGLNDGELVILSKGQFLQNGDKVYPARENR